MAEVVGLKTTVDIGESAKSLKTLKGEFKELQGELDKTIAGSKEYTETLKKMASVKDEIDDLNEATMALTGGGKFQAVANLGGTIAAGFASAQGAMALFGSESKELEQSLLKVQSAMALAQGLKELEGLGDAFNNAKAAAQSLFKVLIANPILAIAAAVTAIGIAVAAYAMKMVDTRTETEKLIDAHKLLNKQYEEQERLLKLVTDRMRAQGKSEREILEATKALTLARIADMEVLVKQEEAQVKAHIEELKRIRERTALEKGLNYVLDLFADGAVRSEEEVMESSRAAMNEYKKSKEELFELKTQVMQIDQQLTKINKGVTDGQKEQIKNTRTLRDLKSEDIEVKKIQNVTDATEKLNDEIKGSIQLSKEQQLQNQLDLLNDEMAREKNMFVRIAIAQQIADVEKQLAEERKKLRAEEDKEEQERLERQKLRRQATLQLTEQALSLTSELVSAFAAKDEASQRKAFEIEKKVKLAQATIDMLKGVQSAFTSAAANPITTVFPGFPFVQAGIAAAFGIANIKKIADTKFEGGGGGAVAGIPSGGGGNTGTFTPLNNTTQQTTTQLNEDGTVKGQGQKVMKAYVLQTDIANEDKKVQMIENKAKIG